MNAWIVVYEAEVAHGLIEVKEAFFNEDDMHEFCDHNSKNRKIYNITVYFCEVKCKYKVESN